MGKNERGSVGGRQCCTEHLRELNNMADCFPSHTETWVFEASLFSDERGLVTDVREDAPLRMSGTLSLF